MLPSLSHTVVEVKVSKDEARVFFHVKFMLFQKAAQCGYNRMPGSIDEDHMEMI